MSATQKCYPLSAPQKAIWYTEKFFPDTGIANISATMRLKAPVDFSLLEKAINLVIENNDSMRIHVCMVDNELRQYIAPYSYKRFKIRNFTASEKSDFYAWESTIRNQPLFAENTDLFHFLLLKIDENTYGYLASLHHLISDSWSMVMLGDEVMRYYLQLKDGQVKQEEKQSYLTFLTEEAAYRQSSRFQKDAVFWREQFETLPEQVGIRARKSRTNGIDAARRTHSIPPEICDRLQRYIERSDSSIFITLMSAFSMYFNRVTNSEDIVIGVPVFGRYSPKMKDTMGMFVETIPLRFTIDSALSYDEHVQTFTQQWLTALRHQRYPIDNILHDVRSRLGDVERLYDILFSYQNAKFKPIEHSVNLSSRWHFNGRQNESLAIHISEHDDNGNIIINYDYLTGLFNERDIDSLHDHYMRLLLHSLDAPHKQIKKIEMISEKDKAQIMNEFNNTDADFPRDRTMLDFFEERVKSSPEEKALVFGDTALTYRKLNSKADALARKLQNRGVRRGSIVALMLRRSFEMMIGMVAVWKAGGAYLPIDPNYPEERIAYTLQDGDVQVMLTTSDAIKPLDFGGEILQIDRLSLRDEKPAQTGLAHNDAAYVIYTSGSTGKAKGVMVEHRALVNRINWMNRKYPLAQDSVILQKTTYTFDVSVWELVWWFFAGVRMVFLAPEAEKHPDRLIDAIEAHKVTTLHFVPTMLSAFLSFVDSHRESGRLSSLREVFTSGEALTPQHVNLFHSLIGSVSGARLYNLYGPTEAAIDVSYYDCPKKLEQRVVPIGKPIDNIKLYVVDQHMNLQPIAVPGELCIAGVGLARGYINKPELTAEKFVENPFSPGERLYKTGDLVQWLPNGDIEYFDRMDHQIKIRGFRIELGDIKYCLEQHPSIREAVVVCCDGAKGEKYLAAYYVSDTEIQTAALKSFLGKQLPEYMVPAFYIRIDRIPLFSNGKANTSLLPSPTLQLSAVASREIVAPRNPVEAFVLRAWSEVLGISELSVTDNFFKMGGDSISAIKMICQMPRPVNVSKLYEHPVLEDFAHHYDEEGDGRILTLLSGEETAERSYILCPYGGGGAYSYFDFANAIIARDPSCCVYSVNLPGHDFGVEAGKFIPIKDSAALILKEAAVRISGSVVVYAHCVGTALGVEITRLFELAGITVEALFIGGILPSAGVSFYGSFFDPWKFVSDKKLMRFLNSVGLSAEGLTSKDNKMMLKAFRYDVRSYYQYFAQFMAKKDKKLSVPVYTILGQIDSMTKGSGKKNWEILSDKFAGVSSIAQAKHYFTKTHAEELAEILIHSLSS